MQRCPPSGLDIIPFRNPGAERRFGYVPQSKMDEIDDNTGQKPLGSVHWHPHLPRFAEILIASLAPTRRLAYQFVSRRQTAFASAWLRRLNKESVQSLAAAQSRGRQSSVVLRLKVLSLCPLLRRDGS
jgi:hypothetical protein